MVSILILNSVMSRKTKEVIGVIRGVQSVIEAGIKLQEDSLRTIWNNSSLKSLTRGCSKTVSKTDITNVNEVINVLNDSSSRINTVLYGIREFVNYTPPTTAGNADHSPLFKTSGISQRIDPKEPSVINHKITLSSADTANKAFEIKLTDSDRALLKKLDMEHRQKIENERKLQAEAEREDVNVTAAGDTTKDENENSGNKVTASRNPKSKQVLSSSSKQRTVPSSRIGRMASFGSLAAGLGIGTLTEYTKRVFGFSDAISTSNPFLTEANMERIVDTLCKVRGAALKIGQLLSIQDESVLNPQLAKALERVRKSADFMPVWQLEKVMVLELGADWRSKYEEFDDKPFAAASIGEVHRGRLDDGLEVAIKIQYPGVAKGIESDIDNLFAVMKLWNVFPEGMFVDNLVLVAKRELAWEVDYIREAECTRKFKRLLEPYPDFVVPTVIDNLSTKQVFTTELLDGIPVDQCVNLDEEHRKYIATKILELILRELLEFRYMQTDPNWANFLYNPNSRKLMLLDFGASREYSKEFVDTYMKIIKAAADGDRHTVLEVSKEIGLLTGYESKAMKKAHVDSIMILGEIFQCPGEYDFTNQTAMERLRNIVPTIITERLCPPPEEIYSLHRKLSGIFLLCTKLKTSVAARDMFLSMYSKYEASK